MSCNEWKESVLKDVIEFNPKETIKKGTLSKKVAMDKLDTFTRKISGYEETEFTSGTKFRNGDTLLARITPCLENGKTARVDILEYNEIGFGSTEFIVMREKEGKTINDFIYYLSISPEFRNIAIKSMTGSSGRQRVQKDVLENVEIKLPPLEEQEKIANILSCLDDKIELNNEMNKTLEEMAQSIFKRWFVDFEFPNEDGKPYKSSGGEMVDSELGMIPKGWEVKCIYDLAEYINGTSFKAKDYSEKGLPIIKIAELKNGVTDGTKFFSGEKDKKFYLKNGDILFSWSGNPDTSIDTFIWDKGDAILNQHIFKVIPKFDKGYAFTYLMLKYLKSTFTHIARNKQTTGLGHVTVKDLKELKIALCFSKIKEFNEVAQPIVDLIFENNMNIEQLNKIRDSLLPKLMSGEIRVK